MDSLMGFLVLAMSAVGRCRIRRLEIQKAKRKLGSSSRTSRTASPPRSHAINVFAPTIFRLKTYSSISMKVTRSEAALWCCDFSWDFSCLITGSVDRTTKLWDVQTSL
ncbi:hypothetical protein PS1_027662 [Malus domestica]